MRLSLLLNLSSRSCKRLLRVPPVPDCGRSHSRRRLAMGVEGPRLTPWGLDHYFPRKFRPAAAQEQETVTTLSRSMHSPPATAHHAATPPTSTTAREQEEGINSRDLVMCAVRCDLRAARLVLDLCWTCAGLRVGCWTPRPGAGKAVHTIYVLLLLILLSHTRS